MRYTAHVISKATSVAVLFGSLSVAMPVLSHADEATIKEGKEIAFDRKKGNCLSCHQIAGGSLPGNIGPALIAMKDRFPDKAKLRAQINDSRVNNPNTIMPPFGAHGILTQSEVDKVTDFIQSL
jgi:sulfur-oxidizing protein SoxX